MQATPQIEKHLKANMNMRKKDIIIANFLGGLAWGLGTVIGATIVAAVIISALRLFNFIPGLDQILQSIPNSPK
ncbi:hypothetical protein KKE78_04775 [Patescibacteria group bacterium]|nr:hypothetical protein [Patescibacteria group bacterium]